MRECECGIDDKGLEVFCVMEGVYGVLCRDCGALSYHGKTKQEAVNLWNSEELQRSVGYFLDGRYEKRAIELGKLIAGIRMD